MLIELESVYKVYNMGEPNAVHALHDVSLAIGEGEMVCLRGPSGSGKTTLLSIIGCIFPPSSGMASIGGRRVSRLPDHFLCTFRREMVGFIFQNFNLLPELSVLENVTLPLYPAGLSPKKRYERAKPLLEKYGIDHRARFPAGRISGWELQRVAICRALVNDPPIVLADEPTAHLDSVLATRFMDDMCDLNEGGKTIILTSHDPRVYERPELDRVIDVVDGRLVREAGTDAAS